MSEPKWSPAPWARWKIQRDPPQHISDGDNILSAELEPRIRHVVAIIARHEGETPEQLSANADLISAAPDLYKALYQTQQILGNSPYRDAYGIIEARLEKNAAALSKARGESVRPSDIAEAVRGDDNDGPPEPSEPPPPLLSK